MSQNEILINILELKLRSKNVGLIARSKPRKYTDIPEKL